MSRGATADKAFALLLATRAGSRTSEFELGDATALPYADTSFDAAVMALVIFFVPEPAKGVAEMARIVKPGGSVSAYAWDIFGGGFPFALLQEEMAAQGIAPLWPPSAQASRIDALRALWQDAGLVDIDTCEIGVQRTFASFDARAGPRDGPERIEAIKTRLRARLPAAADGSITCSARANAIKGRRPA